MGALGTHHGATPCDALRRDALRRPATRRPRASSASPTPTDALAEAAGGEGGDRLGVACRAADCSHVGHARGEGRDELCAGPALASRNPAVAGGDEDGRAAGPEGDHAVRGLEGKVEGDGVLVVAIGDGNHRRE
jgi:hypothetical protein